MQNNTKTKWKMEPQQPSWALAAVTGSQLHDVVLKGGFLQFHDRNFAVASLVEVRK